MSDLEKRRLVTVMSAEAARPTWWLLTLHCGHEVTRRRTFNRQGTELPAPKRVRCIACPLT